jgi:DNA-binding NtrC family response regulator
MSERPRFGEEPDKATETAIRREAEHLPAALRVTIIEGPDAGHVFTLDPNAPSSTLLGTSPACELRLSDPTVSRRHAAFEPLGQRYRITDLGSRNGTFVDGVQVTDAFLRGGETVRCGGTALRFDAEVAAAAPPLPETTRFFLTIGSSRAMRRLYPLCEKLARSRVPVIIEGETGTGKEVLAESLHVASGLRGPFVVFDCTTVAASLLESELFGHERGAFTGAVASRPGVFEEANGGTLLIDEIGDLDLPLQAKLLRVIDRGELRRVGGKQTIKVDVRVLAATRRDLDKAVADGTFRDDLFHRLAVARIELPPLRKRVGDIPLLVRHFVESLGGSQRAIPPSTLAQFEAHPWPGNVRELRNAVARYLAIGEPPLATGDVAVAEAPPQSAPGARTGAIAVEDLTLPFPIARRRVLARFERLYLEHMLAAHGGNLTHAARASGLAVRYFRLVRARNLPSK